MKRETLLKFFSGQLLTVATLAGVVLGVIVGLVVRASSSSQWTEREIMYIHFVGEIFLRMLKGLIIPLVVSSLIAAISSLNLSLSGKIGARAITYYLATTVCAVILGIILVLTIRPGGNNVENVHTANQASKSRTSTTTDTMLDLVRNMFPPNIIQACLEQFQTILKPPQNTLNSSNINDWEITSTYGNGMNVIGLVVTSIVCGVAMSTMSSSIPTLLALVNEFSQMMMKITRWVICISPIGIFFLALSQILEMDDLNVIVGKLGLYLLTVIGGILFHGFVILPAIYYLFTRRNPYTFVLGMGQAIATAFGTASSSATLPVTIQCLEERNKVNASISRFMLPIGATINMDGTALYEAVAAIFIAQLRGLPLSFGKVVAISITSTAASIGAAGIPHAGLVTLVMVLDTVGLPPEDVSLILAVDWILDRVRTVVNVLGDAFGAGIVDFLSQKELKSNENRLNISTVTCEVDTTREI